MMLTRWGLYLAERGWIPDILVRAGIRLLLKRRLQEIHADRSDDGADLTADFVEHMRQSPIAPVPEQANAQHYEVPSRFFELCLGPRRKYSSCYWPDGNKTLDEAEEGALALTAQHADLADGQDILELGCGWGSLTLWMAERYPGSRIVAVSNSQSQREYIEQLARQRKLNNVRVITCDMNVFQPSAFGLYGHFDRIVSVEMFEHMRNYDALYDRVHDWLKPGGKFFKHIFVHRQVPYVFETTGEDDWMGQYFFTGGIMPSDDLPLHFQAHLKLIRRWRWDGRHYAKTLNAWLARMDAHREEANEIIAEAYGVRQARVWRNRWRIFYMACAELFGFNNGQEWWVSHYLFQRPL
ncbi:MAG: class I SAM-dependent methyltransferase [Burkholderiales bacterium]|nr:class I SAM-dependent methyltransferase [Burkholderiales bacterium]